MNDPYVRDTISFCEATKLYNSNLLVVVPMLPFKRCCHNFYEHALINWFNLHKDLSEGYKNVSSSFDEHSFKKGKWLYPLKKK